ncbi:MAG: DUF1775 domain-containing protein [Actinobacteria bacterium]|nr:DUF1775 domain-containing protein [Actinomycetota bacterium]
MDLDARPRWWFTPVIALALLALLAVPAAAHIEAEPNRVEPGESATVGFLVEHGCDDSPTIKVTLKVPKGVKDVEPVEKEGWRDDVDGRTVEFEGGPLDAETPDTFSISFTAPHKTKLLSWKIVQACTDGLIRWIDTSEDAENPPAVVAVGKDVPSHDDEADAEEPEEGH